jgi:hypothetical protein
MLYYLMLLLSLNTIQAKNYAVHSKDLDIPQTSLPTSPPSTDSKTQRERERERGGGESMKKNQMRKNLVMLWHDNSSSGNMVSL